ncbi:MAG: hypothetical protein L0I76_06150, partial [Pseudonocardia sp.]|nr:hypothetical protein [Pseudonocardia sp.]
MPATIDGSEPLRPAPLIAVRGLSSAAGIGQEPLAEPFCGPRGAAGGSSRRGAGAEGTSVAG